MRESRLSPEIKQWIQDAVEKHLDWKSIKNLLRLTEEDLELLESLEKSTTFPPALLVNYHDVQNVITRKLNNLSRKHYQDKTSVQLWMKYLKEQKRRETLFIQHPGDDAPFLVSWISPWQLNLLKTAKEWCIDSTHKTCASFNNSNDSCFLFSLVIKSPVTNQGVPLCFFITDKERQTVIVQWLKWLIEAAGPLPVKKIRIDCSQTEISAIHEVSGQDFDVLLCHWHIKRAWEKHLKSSVKVANSTVDSVNARTSFRALLNSMIRANDEDEYNAQFKLFTEKSKEGFGVFVDYYRDNWHEKRRMWSRPWREDAPFHTNNLIESFHNNLKSNYLGRSRNVRVDKIVYLLSHVVIIDYRQDALRVQIGLKKIHLSPQEEQRKEKADDIDIDEAVYMVTELNDNVRNHILFASTIGVLILLFE